MYDHAVCASQLHAVSLFMLAGHQRVSATPVEVDLELRRLRTGLLNEEYTEFTDAVEDDDRIEIADALADMLYIAYGTLLTYGLPLQYSGQVHQDAMLADVMDDYNAAEIAAVNDTLDDGARLTAVLNLVVVLAYREAEKYDLPLVQVFAEVHRSNLSKFDDEGRAILREDGKILKGPNYSPPDIAAVLTATGAA